MKKYFILMSLALVIAGCNEKQNSYRTGDVVFDAQGFPYYYGTGVDMAQYKTLVEGQGWSSEGFEYGVVDNATGEISTETAVIPGFSYKFYAEGDVMTEYLDVSEDLNGTELAYRTFEYTTASDGFVRNSRENGKIEMRVVSLGTDTFDAFMLTGKHNNGEDCYMLVTFKKMSEKQLQKCIDTYKEPYYKN